MTVEFPAGFMFGAMTAEDQWQQRWGAVEIMAALGLDILSALTSVAATLGNIGPGLGVVGPMDNFAGVPQAGKWVLSLCMLLGRLELFTVLMLFVPGTWKR